MAAGFRDPLAGIESFAPEFWRLVAEPVPRAAPAEPSVSAPDAAPEIPPEPAPGVAPEQRLPKLTNDALRDLRSSIGGRADNLQDIPAPLVPPYPPFTGAQPPLTNEALRGLRDSESGFGELRDIPPPPPGLHVTPPQADPEVAAWLAPKILEVGELRSTIERLEAEKRKPDRSRHATAFDQEIETIQGKIEGLETDIAKGALRLPRHRDPRT